MKKIFVFAIFGLMLMSCGPVAQLTKGEQYSQMYREKPNTILIMPPINNSTNVEAKDLLYTSISRPLIEAGYYVLSPNLVMDVLKNESAYDSELFLENDLNIFHKVLGADAVAFSIIDTWTKKGLGIETKIHYILKSTHTNEVLFEKSCDLYLDLMQNSGSNSAFSALIDLAASALITATTDHIVAARKCNYFIFKDIPYGKYSPFFDKDKESTAMPKDIRQTVK